MKTQMCQRLHSFRLQAVPFYLTTDTPKPQGPVKILQGDEYKAARKAADAANREIHKINPALNGKQIHEIKPVKFNGSPTDPNNKLPVSPNEHHEFNNFWRNLQRYLEDK